MATDELGLSRRHGSCLCSTEAGRAPTPGEALLNRLRRRGSRLRLEAGWGGKLAVIALLVLAAAVRLWGLGRESLWFDEAYSVAFGRNPLSAFSLINLVGPPFTDRNLYHLFLHFWLAVGSREWLIRLPSVAFGVATVCVVCRLGTALWGRRTGLLAGLLLALSPFHVWFSQEARMYALVTLLVAIASLLFWRLLDSDGSYTASSNSSGGGSHAAVLISYVLIMTLALYTHSFALFVLLFHNLYLGARFVLRAARGNTLQVTGHWPRSACRGVSRTAPSPSQAADSGVCAHVATGGVSRTAPTRTCRSHLKDIGIRDLFQRTPTRGYTTAPTDDAAGAGTPTRGCTTASGLQLVLHWALAQLALFLLYLPWLRGILSQQGWGWWAWIDVQYGPANLRSLFRVLTDFAYGGSVPGPWVAGWALALGFGLLILVGALRHESEGWGLDPSWLFVAGLLAVPVGLAFVASQFRNMFIPRYLLPFLPGFVLLVARGIGRLPWRALRIGALAAIIFISAVALTGAYLRQDKEDWRGVAAEVTAGEQPGDFIFLMDEDTITPFRHYYQGPAAMETVWRGRSESDLLADLIDRAVAGHPRIWLVLSHTQNMLLEEMLAGDPRLHLACERQLVGVSLARFDRVP